MFLFFFSLGCGYIVNEVFSICIICNKDFFKFRFVFFSFDMLIDFIDYIGIFYFCSFTGSVVEEILGCMVNSKKGSMFRNIFKLSFFFLKDRLFW